MKIAPALSLDSYCDADSEVVTRSAHCTRWGWHTSHHLNTCLTQNCVFIARNHSIDTSARLHLITWQSVLFRRSIGADRRALIPRVRRWHAARVHIFWHDYATFSGGLITCSLALTSCASLLCYQWVISLTLTRHRRLTIHVRSVLRLYGAWACVSDRMPGRGHAGVLFFNLSQSPCCSGSNRSERERQCIISEHLLSKPCILQWQHFSVLLWVHTNLPVMAACDWHGSRSRNRRL